ncbi:MraY family glycosyltransferase [Rhodocyclus purpureus]|uniref:MraY family glycosyltransferase n=1 Tax=Rhodocyclus purpureus TaxID=1067 RepID=UPI0019131FB9|nr:glycosyltransferase [Rhodocyclus purpureus]MBK5914531.1 glycosyl transferase [Rhodocyclus purpureus]
MNLLDELLPLLLSGFLASFAVCVLLVATKRWHGAVTLDNHEGVQKFHTAPTPRVGGIALMAGLFAACSQIPGSSELLAPMIIAGVPAFLFGLAEDLTKRVGVRERLLATMTSGVLAWWLTGYSMTRVDVWGADILLSSWLPLSVAFTAFAVAGVANAINIIDGFNGLASGTALICLAALGLIAWEAGDPLLAKLCLVLGAVILGFWLANFPLGKIFLGDGGAYLTGFLIAWVAVMLPMRNPEVSVWAALLACAYPVLEVGFSMARRFARSQHPGHPDRLHLHSLVKSRVIKKLLLRWKPVLRNSAVSPLLWLYALLPALLAVFFYDNTPALIASFVASAILYQLLYRRLVHFRWKLISHVPIGAAAAANKAAVTRQG